MIGLTQGRKAFGLGKAMLLAGLTVAAVVGSGMNRAARAQDTIYGFTTTGLFFSVNSATPGTLGTINALSGLAAGSTLLDIDFRPANGILYGLAQNGTTLSLYTITTTGTASFLTNLTGVTATASSYDIDFNPAANALRIVGNNGDNFRVAGAQIGTGLGGTITDTALNGAATTGIVGAAYTNNFAGTTTTTLYDISTTGQLYRQGANPGNGIAGDPGNPNSGVLTSIGATGITGAELGFDISGITNTAYVSNGANLYTINLTTGAQTSSAAFSGLLGGNVRGISAITPTAAPEPGSLVLLGTGLVSMGGIAVRRKAKKA